MLATIVPCQTDDRHFQQLVRELNLYLADKDGDEHGFYDQFNHSSSLDYAVVLRLDNQPAGCGALRQKDADRIEIKRMYTAAKYRRCGVAQQILVALEEQAKRLGFKEVILETGKRQEEAVKFYKAQGYIIIPKYAPYKQMKNSLCFGKKL